jgi:hypothetical protein
MVENLVVELVVLSELMKEKKWVERRAVQKECRWERKKV